MRTVAAYASALHSQGMTLRAVATQLEQHGFQTSFERDLELKSILSDLHSRPVRDAVAGLEAFLVDNKLLAEASSERVTAQQIRREDIRLIAYEWLV